jgi:hypothetical protein
MPCWCSVWSGDGVVGENTVRCHQVVYRVRTAALTCLEIRYYETIVKREDKMCGVTSLFVQVSRNKE